ncbi:MAG: excinuclease ABC subunit UvrC [Brevinematia bacterium]
MKIIENRGYFTPSELDNIPESAGVYIMKDNSGRVIYVGKAKNLKKRILSYFQKRSESVKTHSLVENIAFIDTISVSGESEALILEANLIKEFKPKYNVQFKDNKFYPFIKVTMAEKFPRVVFAREKKSDGIYFGPFVSAKSVRMSIDLIQKLFLLRTCKKLPARECLNYHIKRCSAPCINKISEDEYNENLSKAIDFLKGDYKKLIIKLEREMKEAASKLMFEKAQLIKEKIEAIKLFEESQSVFMNEEINRDYVGLYLKWGRVVIVVSIIRNGKMVGKRSFSSSVHFEESEEDILSQFLMDYIKEMDEGGKEIVVEKKFEVFLSQLNNLFSEKGVRIITPENSVDVSLIGMANENAALHFSQLWTKVDTSEGLELLKELLGLKKTPMRIEGFDVANILGEHSVASVVSFYGGKPDKSNYRRMKIRTKSSPDDCAMIYEAVYRRYNRLKRENKELPDLVLIDGGKGQLNAALSAISELGISLDVVSLAKKEEEIFLPDSDTPLSLPKNSPALHILQQVRDETHRFANEYFRKLKVKKDLESIFDGIKGIGEKRKRIIVQKFLNYDIIKNLKREDLLRSGIPENLLDEVYRKLKIIGEKGEIK